MPHLSPMSWLSAIIAFWAITLFITSTTWWSNNHLFDVDKSHHMKKSQHTWSWNLQDGWE